MKKARIFIIEPSELIIKGFYNMFSHSTTIDIVGHLYNLEKSQETLLKSDANILLINPRLFSFSDRFSIRAYFQNLNNVILGAIIYNYHDNYTLSQYHLLIDITDNKHYIENKIISSLSNNHDNEHISNNGDNSELSYREKDVLTLLAKGMMNKEIADALNISIHTVISHRKNITRKTDIKSIAGLTVYALLHNLIDKNDII